MKAEHVKIFNEINKRKAKVELYMEKLERVKLETILPLAARERCYSSYVKAIRINKSKVFKLAEGLEKGN